MANTTLNKVVVNKLTKSKYDQNVQSGTITPTMQREQVWLFTDDQYVSQQDKTNWDNKADSSAIPTKTSDLTNDSGFITNADVPSKTSDLTNDSGFITSADIPTDVSAFTNDAGYITTETDPTVPAWAKEPTKPTYTKSEVGLSNVDNKSSETIRSEITSSNITNALGFTPMDSALKGTSNGVAELDNTGKVPSSQLPSYVDDVVEGYFYNDKFWEDSSHTIEIPASSGKIYVDVSTDITYRWSGSAYVAIGSSLTLGETSTTAYRGDRGKIAYDHSQSPHAPANAEANTIDTISVNNTTITPDANKNVDITIPTATSDLLNDSGFITTETDPVFTASAAHGISSSDITNWNAKASTSDIKDGTLTITNNNTTLGTFTANQSSNTTIDLSVPTKTSDLVNDSHFVTSSDDSLPNIVELTYEEYKQLETNNLLDPNTEYHIAEDSSQGITEEDPIFTSSPAYTITNQDISNWNSASGGGLTLLSYGHSTWQDFINAFNENKVVYCKVSSTDNPAATPQKRFAFMAFTSIPVSEITSVEFQYYRSVSSHSDTQQGDQTYIYTLSNENGGTWSYTVRENYTKIVAGSNLTSSYSNGVLTLNGTAPNSTYYQQVGSSSATAFVFQDAKVGHYIITKSNATTSLAFNYKMTSSGSMTSLFALITDLYITKTYDDASTNEIFGYAVGIDASGNIIHYKVIKTTSVADAMVLLSDNATYNPQLLSRTAQTITGVKTFSSVPVCSTQPSNNSDLANKAYVDDQVSQAIIEVSTLPTASSTLASSNIIYHYIGTTTGTYIYGYFYHCIVDPEDPTSYIWERIDVQPAGGGEPTWDYVIDALDVITIPNTSGSTSATISDAGLLAQLNQIITDGVFDSDDKIKPLNIGILVNNDISPDTSFITCQQIMDDTADTLDESRSDGYLYLSFVFNYSIDSRVRTLSLDYQKEGFDDNNPTWRYFFYNFDNIESTSHRVTSITSSSTNYQYPTAKAVYDIIPPSMSILKYGISTWNDFITAYNSKSIVYCRASSAANPASGSQTRMAFMAYVNNETTPTQVEFQYVRSMTSHTATNQGDQVFVYLLKNTNGGTWSVTTREMSTKIVAGAGLSSSYSSGTLTLTCPDKEVTTNKVTSLSSSSTDTQYPSAKCVYDTLETYKDSYSTTEVRTNRTWIDGKPIYKKTIDYGQLPDSIPVTVNSGITGSVTVVNIYGIGIASSGNCFPLPYVNMFNAGDNIELVWLGGSNEIRISTSSDKSGIHGYVTVEYTKATD